MFGFWILTRPTSPDFFGSTARGSRSERRYLFTVFLFNSTSTFSHGKLMKSEIPQSRFLHNSHGCFLNKTAILSILSRMSLFMNLYDRDLNLDRIKSSTVSKTSIAASISKGNGVVAWSTSSWSPSSYHRKLATLLQVTRQNLPEQWSRISNGSTDAYQAEPRLRRTSWILWVPFSRTRLESPFFKSSLKTRS